MLSYLKRRLTGFNCPCGGGDSGGGGGAPAQTTTISKTEPPAYVQPYSEQLMTRAGDLSNAQYTPYSGNRIADLNQYHQAGLQGTAARAINGSPLMNSASAMLTDTAMGAYMSPNSNPYLADTVRQAQDSVQARIGAMDRGSGSFGNSGVQYMAGRGMADATNNVYAQNYQNERTNQMRTAMFAPQMAEADYKDAQALLGVGDVYRDDSQQRLNQQYQDWQQQQQWPYQQLDVLANAIRTSMGGGGTSVTSAPNAFQTNPTANMIGGGMLGYGLGGAAGVNPWLGAGGGALLGGLL